jgi:hypothetical protein
MAGLAAEWGRWGQPKGDVYKHVEEPTPQQQPQQPSVNTAPTKPKLQFSHNTADRNAPRPNFRYSGMMANQRILPQVGDPFRTYGNVSGGRMTPPSNPFAETPGIRYTPGGEWGGNGPGPINTGPTQPPPMMGPRDGNFGGQGPIPNTNPYLERGGFTGGQMPPGMQSGTSGAMSQPSRIPGRGQYPPSTGFYRPPQGIPSPIPSNPNRGMGNRGFKGMYGGGQENQLFY